MTSTATRRPGSSPSPVSTESWTDPSHDVHDPSSRTRSISSRALRRLIRRMVVPRREVESDLGVDPGLARPRDHPPAGQCEHTGDDSDHLRGVVVVAEADHQQTRGGKHQDERGRGEPADDRHDGGVFFASSQVVKKPARSFPERSLHQVASRSRSSLEKRWSWIQSRRSLPNAAVPRSSCSTRHISAAQKYTFPCANSSAWYAPGGP